MYSGIILPSYTKNVKPPRNATKQHKEKGKTIVGKDKVKRKNAQTCPSLGPL
jgi:hypothetical protein